MIGNAFYTTHRSTDINNLLTRTLNEENFWLSYLNIWIPRLASLDCVLKLELSTCLLPRVFKSSSAWSILILPLNSDYKSQRIDRMRWWVMLPSIKDKSNFSFRLLLNSMITFSLNERINKPSCTVKKELLDTHLKKVQSSCALRYAKKLSPVFVIRERKLILLFWEFS